MSYRFDITWRQTATIHPKAETVVADLADVARLIAEGAPDPWDVCYIVVQPTTAQPTAAAPPKQPAEFAA